MIGVGDEGEGYPTGSSCGEGEDVCPWPSPADWRRGSSIGEVTSLGQDPSMQASTPTNETTHA